MQIFIALKLRITFYGGEKTIIALCERLHNTFRQHDENCETFLSSKYWKLSPFIYLWGDMIWKMQYDILTTASSYPDWRFESRRHMILI